MDIDFDPKKIGLYALIAFGFFLVSIISAAIGYALNRDIIDAIQPGTVHWWHAFTFDNYQQWLFHYNPGAFIGAHVVIAILIFVVLMLSGEYIFD